MPTHARGAGIPSVELCPSAPVPWPRAVSSALGLLSTPMSFHRGIGAATSGVGVSSSAYARQSAASLHLWMNAGHPALQCMLAVQAARIAVHHPSDVRRTVPIGARVPEPHDEPPLPSGAGVCRPNIRDMARFVAGYRALGHQRSGIRGACHRCCETHRRSGAVRRPDSSGLHCSLLLSNGLA